MKDLIRVTSGVALPVTEKFHRVADEFRTHLRLRSIATLVVTGVLVAIGWATLAPTAVGGPASYVVTDGISMLPRFHADGLVVTRTQDSYHVGEVAAYHNHQLHTVVMHRIIGIDGGRYIFKGDNNADPDSYHATKADIVGEEWVYWPGGGRYLNDLRNPLTFAIVIGLITLLAFRPSKPSRRRRRHHA